MTDLTAATHPDANVRARAARVGAHPLLHLAQAAVALYDAGCGAQSRAAREAFSRLGDAMVVLNAAPLGFQGGFNPTGPAYPGTPPRDPAAIADPLAPLAAKPEPGDPPPPPSPSAWYMIETYDGARILADERDWPTLAEAMKSRASEPRLAHCTPMLWTGQAWAR